MEDPSQVISRHLKETVHASYGNLILMLFSLLLMIGCGGLEATSVSSPTPYYVQFEDADGIAIKAASSVEPKALKKARDIANEMLSGDKDVRDSLVTAGAAIAVIPRDTYIYLNG